MAGETPSLTEEFVGGTHRVLEHTQTHPPRNQHQKDPIYLWVVEEVTESQQRAKQVAVFPLGPFPFIQQHSTTKWVAPASPILKAPPLTTQQAHRDKKFSPNERTGQSSRKKINK